MYLAKFKLNKKTSAARKSLSDRQELHKIIQKMFNSDRKASEVLYRINGDSVYVSSNKAPAEVGELIFESGREMPVASGVKAFTITTLPKKSIEGKRYPLIKESERLEWFHRQAEKNGFEVLSIREVKKETVESRKKGFSVTAYTYQGTLMVLDSAKFEKARLEGIGPMKAYGLGMLIVA